jgi:tRNA nucleotidyltransferase (CCA-adding enzyme)
VKVETTGYDLKAMGIKPGPIYSRILSELYRLRLNGIITSKEKEIVFIHRLLKEDSV